MIHRSVEQSHSFNCPFQLSNLPDAESTPNSILRKLFESIKSPKINDCAFDGKCESVCLRKGDVIVAGTDGVFDNMYEKDIGQIIENTTKKEKNEKVCVYVMARCIVETAREKSENKNWVSPFARKAMKEGQKHRGGKRDDTLAIVHIYQGMEHLDF